MIYSQSLLGTQVSIFTSTKRTGNTQLRKVEDSCFKNCDKQGSAQCKISLDYFCMFEYNVIDTTEEKNFHTPESVYLITFISFPSRFFWHSGQKECRIARVYMHCCPTAKHLCILDKITLKSIIVPLYDIRLTINITFSPLCVCCGYLIFIYLAFKNYYREEIYV